MGHANDGRIVQMHYAQRNRAPFAGEYEAIGSPRQSISPLLWTKKCEGPAGVQTGALVSEGLGGGPDLRQRQTTLTLRDQQ